MKRVLSLLLVLTCLAQAELKLGTPFTEDMVVQHDQPLTVWGWDAPGQTVVVELGDQGASTKSDQDGRWELEIGTPAPGGPYAFEVRGSETIEFTNVLSGEVWLASGQSNMGWPLSKNWNPEKHIAAAQYPDIRVLKLRLASTDEPQATVEADPWFAVSPDTAGDVSGVAYFFARRLHHELDMPIGIIQSAWGGSKIQSWIPCKEFSKHPSAEEWTQVHEERVVAYGQELNEWRANDQKGDRPRPAGGGPQHKPSGLYNAMIHPVQPYAIKGAIWYQGESDSWMKGDYTMLFSSMVDTWREGFASGDFPVYFAQLPDFKQAHWGRFRLEQAAIPALVPNTDYAVLIGAGDYDDIHPRDKQTPGHRLSQLALAHDYDFDIVPGGPIPVSIKRDGGEVRILFDRVGKGLELKSWEQGSQIVFFADQTKIEPKSIRIENKDTLILEVPDGTPTLTDVRYATYANPQPEIWNKDGFPGTPFQFEL